MASRSEGWLSERFVLIDDAFDPLMPLYWIDALIDVAVDTLAEFARLTFALSWGETSWKILWWLWLKFGTSRVLKEY